MLAIVYCYFANQTAALNVCYGSKASFNSARKDCEKSKSDFPKYRNGLPYPILIHNPCGNFDSRSHPFFVIRKLSSIRIPPKPSR